jgi:ADP-ribose pyrophosphatase
MPDFAHLGDREVHRGHLWSVVVGEFRSPDGVGFQRDLVRSPGAVGVVALLFDPEGQPSVVLVEQYRPALDTTLIEIPAGMRDVDGEPPETTAARELAEEAGLCATTLSRLGQLHPSPGMTDSSTIIYLATGCEPTESSPQGPEEDHLEVVHLPLSEAMAMVSDGRITDAKTVIGLLMAERALGSE